MSLLLQLLSVAHLQPTLGWFVSIAVLVGGEGGEIISKSGNLVRLTLLGREVGRRHPSQRRARREEREEIRGQFICHDRVVSSFDK